ncbi:MAG TPA: NYN domain-containing protein [Candidatus Saccharimonadales bacterium]
MKKQSVTYAFIDSQNLNLGVRSQGWRIDYKKFRLYLKNKYGVENAYLFIGMMDNNQGLYTDLQQAGFLLVFKPTVRYVQDGRETVKGNVDAELVLYAAAKVFDQYDRALIVSGDGDFHCLAEYLEEQGKLLHIVVPNGKYSKLLRRFTQFIVRFDLLRSKLEYRSNKKSQSKRSVETLGRTGGEHGSSGRSKP